MTMSTSSSGGAKRCASSSFFMRAARSDRTSIAAQTGGGGPPAGAARALVWPKTRARAVGCGFLLGDQSDTDFVSLGDQSYLDALKKPGSVKQFSSVGAI